MTVAIAYLMQKAQYVFPMIGGRKVEHLHSNIEALDVVLTAEHISKIEAVVPFDSGFPVNFMVSHVFLRKIFTVLSMFLNRETERLTTLHGTLPDSMTSGPLPKPYVLRTYKRAGLSTVACDTGYVYFCMK